MDTALSNFGPVPCVQYVPSGIMEKLKEGRIDQVQSDTPLLKTFGIPIGEDARLPQHVVKYAYECGKETFVDMKTGKVMKVLHG